MPNANALDPEIRKLMDAVNSISDRLKTLAGENSEEEAEPEDTSPEPVIGAKQAPGDESHSETEERAASRLAADTRADRSVNRRLRDLERDHARSDADLNELSELQQLWGHVVSAHGDKVSIRPMIGENPLSYDRRFASRYQRFSDKWRGVNLRELPVEALRIACPEVRKDSLSRAYEAPANAEPMLREEILIDPYTGTRRIRFHGPVRAINGMIAPFALPRMRAKFLPQPQRGY
jgi:hypothetical protein